MTASARSRNGSGIVMPSAFAVRWITRSNVVGCSTRTSAAFAPRPGLLAWQIVLIVAQPGRKSDSDASAGELPVFGKIVEDDFSRVFI